MSKYKSHTCSKKRHSKCHQQCDINRYRIFQLSLSLKNTKWGNIQFLSFPVFQAECMLLRTLEVPRLLTGTRIKALKQNIVESIVLTGCAKGHTVLILRIPIIPSHFPFTFKRSQISIKLLAFALPIYNAQY